MASISSYLLNYRDKTFDEEPFNEIDNVVFSSLSYLNFTNIVSDKREYISLYDAGSIYLKHNSYMDAIKLGIAQKDAYRILKLIVDSIRYKDVLLYNYEYDSDPDKQFGALTFKINKKLIYVSFEGTDNLLSGWKEDFQMSYQFPVPSQQCAIDYLNRNIKLLDKNIIIGGHSKGGNLSLVAAMCCKNIIRWKIKQIYNNDGPGLRKKQMDSKEYNRVKNKYIHIIPNYSYVGILLRNDNYKVIKTSRKDIMSHSILTWQVEDNFFKEVELSVISKSLEESVIMWLDDHDDELREKMVTTVFQALEDSNIYTLNDFINVRKSLNVIKKLKDVDKETKDLLSSFIQFNFEYLMKNIKK